jgi:transposase
VRTVEGNSPDWIQIGEVYRSETLSIRALAKRFGLSDTAIRKAAKKNGWTREAANQQPCEPAREPERELPQTRFAPRRRVTESASVKDLTARGRNIILALMDELEFLNSHATILSELVEINFGGEKDSSARAKLLKALDHETRTKSSNQLATALAKLNDAMPGKKEQAEEDAKTAAAGTEWGDLEEDTAPTRVN